MLSAIWTEGEVLMKDLKNMIKDAATVERLNSLMQGCLTCYIELDNDSCEGCLNREALIAILGAEAEKKKAPYQWFLR